MFYPGDPRALAAEVEDLLGGAGEAEPRLDFPKALIVPHAGYIYSGAIAASAYQLLRSVTEIERVVVIGPSHRVPIRGLAASGAQGFETPLGTVAAALDLRDQALAHGAVHIDDSAHAQEHSLEVQLPFLQTLLPDVPVLLLAVGHVSPDDVADVLDLVWADKTTLLVVSTDLSHYYDYATARARDRRTADAIAAVDVDGISTDDACGAYPLRGALEAVRRRDGGITELDLRNSGDTAGGHNRVVGYGAFAIT
jgi:AmmeMemoRadiSam system protein B